MIWSWTCLSSVCIVQGTMCLHEQTFVYWKLQYIINTMFAILLQTDTFLPVQYPDKLRNKSRYWSAVGWKWYFMFTLRYSIGQIWRQTRLFTSIRFLTFFLIEDSISFTDLKCCERRFMLALTLKVLFKKNKWIRPCPKWNHHNLPLNPHFLWRNASLTEVPKVLWT